MVESPKIEKVVIAGGGVAALEAALALEHLTGGLLHTTLVSPQPEFTYRPARVAEPFNGPLAQTYLLGEVLAGTNCTRIQDQVTWVDPSSREVHTGQSGAIEYDALLLAMGARTSASFPNVTTLDVAHLDDQLHGVIQDIEGGWINSLAFVIPDRAVWPLPVYELALMTARRANEMYADPRIILITPEEAPLAIFGNRVSEAVTALLSDSGIEVITGSSCTASPEGHLRLWPGGRHISVERVIALPELHGDAVAGIPRNANGGFVAVDRHSRVIGLDGVYAAGDMTDFPVKQGGIAAQQADAAAESIAALAGAEIEPRPLVAELHAVLWGGPKPLYLSARVTGQRGTDSKVSTSPLCGQSGKIYAPFLAPRLEALDQAHSSRF